ELSRSARACPAHVHREAAYKTSGKSGAFAQGSEREDVAVGGAFHPIVEWKLVGTVDDHEALRARFPERGDRFLRGQMPTEAVAAFDALAQRRLAEEEVGVASDLRELRAWRRVARVGERRGAVADTQRERLQLVMRNAHGRHLEPARL